MRKHVLILFAAAAMATATAGYAARPGQSSRHAAETAPLAPGEHEVLLRGVRFHYRVAGRGSARSAPVVYLAGGPGGTGYVFSRTAGPPLERGRTLVYYDQRGTGRSERPASGDYAIATLVDDIEALRVHLGVPRVTLIAHSFAGVLALEYAARYPEGLAAAVLAAPLWDAPMACREGLNGLAARDSELHRRIVQGGEPADSEVCASVIRALPPAQREAFFEGNMFPNPATRERVRGLDAESGMKNSGEMSSALFRAGLLQYRFSNLAKVRAPVLVIAGEKDLQAGLQTQRNLAERLPNARLLVYPGLGHWMFVDDPQRFARDVSRFLSKAKRRGRAASPSAAE